MIKTMSKSSKSIFLLMISFAFLAVDAIAQNPPVNRFIKSIGGSNAENSYGIENTLDGGFILGGATSSYGRGNKDMFLIKTDGSGTTQWQKTYGGTDDETAWDVISASDSGFIMIGTSKSYGNGKGDALVVKTDKDGNVSWTRAIGTDSLEEAYAGVQSRSGSIYITGWAVTDTFGSDLFIAKLTSNGNLSWFKTFGDRGDEEGFAIFEDSRGNIVASGFTNWDSVSAGFANGNPGDRDVFVVKTDTNGNLNWQRNFGGDQNDEAWGIAEYRGDYYLTGFTQSFNAIGRDVFMMQLDQAGNHLNTVSLQDFEDERAFDIKHISGTANFYISGYQQRIGFTERNVFWMEISSNGNIFNYEIIGGTDRDGHWPTEAVRVADNGYAILSTERSYHSGNDDNLLLIKTNEDGRPSCQSRSSLQAAQPVQIADSSMSTWRDRSGNSSPSLSVSNFSPDTDTTICCELNALVADDSVSICVGTSVGLGGPAISGIQYRWTDMNNSSYASDRANPIVSPDSSTVYKLVVTSTNNACAADSATIIVNVKRAIPSSDLIQDTSFCEGSSFTLRTFIGQSLYDWSGSNVSGSSSAIILTQADTVALFLIDNLGCQYRDTAIVSVNALPRFSLGNDTTICANETITLNGPLSNIALYNWNNGQSTDPSFTTALEQSHILQVTDSNGCSWSDTISLFNNPVSPFTLGPDTGFCAGSNYTIIGPGFLNDFRWNGNSSQSPNLTVNQPGTYWLSAANSFLCRFSDTITIIEYALPNLDLGADTGFCSGEQLVLSSPLVGTYLWNGNPSRDKDTFRVVSPGTYFLQYSDENNCSDTDTILVERYPNPVVDLGADTTICIGDTLVLDAGSGNASYLWSDNSTDQILRVFNRGTYNVLVTSDQGCETFDEIVVDTVTCTNNIDILPVVGLKVYPNPAVSSVQLEWTSASEPTLIELIDLNGKLVLSQQFAHGTRSASIDVSELSGGFYFITVSQGTQSSRIKLLKANR
jgi:hypothetical protein